MKTIIFKVVFILLFPFTLIAQVLNVYQNDGTLYQVEISEIDSITFSPGNSGYGVPCPGVPTVIYEGKTYNTVLIGSQCWLKENLDVGTQITGHNDDAENLQTDNGTIEKYCYLDNPDNCTKYGGLYQWFEATKYYDLSNYDNDETYDLENVQGICPDGWHLPNGNDYDILIQTVSESGDALREVGQTTDDEGVNSSGFSALLGGNYNHQIGYDNYQGLNDFTNLLSTTIRLTINGAEYPKSLSIGLSDNISFGGHGDKIAESVRCIKD